MKQFLMVPFLLALFANPGWCDIIIEDINAASLNSTNVGVLDSFEASKYYKPSRSNPATETTWVNSVLPTTVAYDFKAESVDYYATNTTDTYAFFMAPPSISEYFLIKNDDYWVLFANNVEMNWGVFNKSQLPAGMNMPGGNFVISHVTRFDGDPVSVPEPSIFLLVSAALAGLGFYSRKLGKN